MAQGRPHSFLHVIRPEIDLPEGIDVHADAVYARGRENLERFIREIPFTEEREPSLYVYRLRMDGRDADRRRRVLLGGRVRRRPDPQTRADAAGQGGRPDAPRRGDAAARRSRSSSPTATARTSTRWSPRPCRRRRSTTSPPTTACRTRCGGCAPPGDLVDAFARVPLLYVADGHHRAASASRARAHFRDRNPRHTGNEEYNRVLATLFPAGQLRILPYNRVVADLGGRSPRATSWRALGARFPLSPADDPQPARRGDFRVCVAEGDAAALARLPHRAAAGGERHRRPGREPAAGRGARAACSGSTIRGRARASSSSAASAAPRSWRSASAKGAPPPPSRCSRPPWRS